MNLKILKSNPTLFNPKLISLTYRKIINESIYYHHPYHIILYTTDLHFLSKEQQRYDLQSIV